MIQGQRAIIAGPLHHYLCHVLRLRKGDRLLLVDGAIGTEYDGAITGFSSDEVTVEITGTRPAADSRVPRLVQVHGLSRRTKSELVLQKSTELGVDWLLPALCHRSVSRPREPARKLERWQQIVTDAARQCGRSTLPRISPAAPLEQALQQSCGSADLCLLASPGGRSLAELAPRIASPRTRCIALAVGPEGGFTEEEERCAVGLGFEPVNLGPLVLRTETAAVVLLALVAHLAGRL